MAARQAGSGLTKPRFPALQILINRPTDLVPRCAQTVQCLVVVCVHACSTVQASSKAGEKEEQVAAKLAFPQVVLSIVSARSLQLAGAPPIIAVVVPVDLYHAVDTHRLMTTSDVRPGHTPDCLLPSGGPAAGQRDRPARRLHAYFNNCAAVVRQHVG